MMLIPSGYLAIVWGHEIAEPPHLCLGDSRNAIMIHEIYTVSHENPKKSSFYNEIDF